jgi:orotate phosphoribosyltransferase
MTDTERAELIADLAREAYSEGDIVLSSGTRSSFYIDGKLATYYPHTARRLGRAVWDMVKGEQIAGVGGLTLGSDAISIAVMFAALDDGELLPAFSVRKEPKGHGKRKLIEGRVPEPGSRIAIVDDVVTSGKSILQAVRAVEDEGLTVAIVVPLVDREEGAAEKILNRGLKYRPFCTLTEIRAAYRGHHAHA